MFKTMNELKQYIEWECPLIVNEPERCCVCEKVLKDSEGYEQYYLCEEFTLDKFCSEKCIENYLIEQGYLEEDK